MTSKTFKSAWPNHPRRINIREIEDGVNVRISEPQWEDKKGITLAPSDAPALALAILEAAGYTEDDRDDSGLTHFAIAMTNLRLGIAQQERATAEAEAQAKLEAEALELFKASGAYGSDRFFLKFSDLEETTQSAWLAVARRAREMRAEK